MNVLLPSDFHGEKYGLTYRLVNESDAEYILSLRTDTWHTRFIHSTDNDLAKQIEWIRSYKQREREGREYYFIYFLNGKPIGVNRVYNIFEYYGTIGSWICNPDNEPETSLKTNVLLYDLIFEHVKLDITLFDVRKANKHVWKLHKMFGAEQVGESEIDYYFTLFKDNYLNKRENVLSMFNLND